MLKMSEKIGQCPYCGEADIEYGTLILDGEGAYYEVTCNMCENDSREYYKLEFDNVYGEPNVIKENGTLIEEYPVDENQNTPNAGSGYKYKYGNNIHEIIIWNNTAEEHEDGQETIKLVE